MLVTQFKTSTFLNLRTFCSSTSASMKKRTEDERGRREGGGGKNKPPVRYCRIKRVLESLQA